MRQKGVLSAYCYKASIAAEYSQSGLIIDIKRYDAYLNPSCAATNFSRSDYFAHILQMPLHVVVLYNQQTKVLVVPQTSTLILD